MIFRWLRKVLPWVAGITVVALVVTLWWAVVVAILSGKAKSVDQGQEVSREDVGIVIMMEPGPARSEDTVITTMRGIFVVKGVWSVMKGREAQLVRMDNGGHYLCIAEKADCMLVRGW